MDRDAGQLWDKALAHLKSLLNPELFRLWFEPIRLHRMEGGVLFLEVADDFREVWLKDNYLSLIREALVKVAGEAYDIRFHVNPALASTAPKTEPARSDTPVADRNGAKSARRGAGTLMEGIFNPNNTFETFVVGSSNRFAHGAALAVAQSPGKSYNPLFLYGGSGLGKTHLLHAVGQHVLSHRKNTKVAYLSCERFTNEFIEAIQNNQLGRFRRKYRQTDVLLIDDVQFLAGKERIQEEFFHTFNALHESRKQLILTCDRTASEIQNLEQRLVTRFEWGLVTDLQKPDVETRTAILRKKEQTMGIQLPEDVLNFIAERIRTNIRRMEGAMIKVHTYSMLTGKPVTVELAENLLREILHEEGHHTLTIEVIQKKVADHFDIRLADMTSKRRPENIAFPRQIAMFLSRSLTDKSLNNIGEAFGGRDHGTVLHACQKVKDRMELDANIRHVVQYLERQLMR